MSRIRKGLFKTYQKYISKILYIKIYKFWGHLTFRYLKVWINNHIDSDVVCFEEIMLHNLQLILILELFYRNGFMIFINFTKKCRIIYLLEDYGFIFEKLLLTKLETLIFSYEITYFGLCSRDFPDHLQTLLLMNIAIKILYFQTFQLKGILWFELCLIIRSCSDRNYKFNLSSDVFWTICEIQIILS